MDPVNDGFEEGGHKQSGLGRLRGARGLADFQEIKTYVHFVPPSSDCHRRPDSKRLLQPRRHPRRDKRLGVPRSESPHLTEDAGLIAAEAAQDAGAVGRHVERACGGSRPVKSEPSGSSVAGRNGRESPDASKRFRLEIRGAAR